MSNFDVFDTRPSFQELVSSTMDLFDVEDERRRSIWKRVLLTRRQRRLSGQIARQAIEVASSYPEDEREWMVGLAVDGAVGMAKEIRAQAREVSPEEINE